MGGAFDPTSTGGTPAGWSAQVTTVEVSPVQVVNDFVLDRVDLEVWWMNGEQRRSFKLEGYRRRPMTDEDRGGPK